ncbi:MAG TPA: hypothetical protein VGQ62_11005 [Chloroflexota bacterium]|jgi:hypothetical protein|nr:hypothetical protein [Chloroflexota bacterium]
MVVPAYCRSREGRVWRVLRSSALVAPDRVRFALRAVPVKQDGNPGCEVAREFDTSSVREQIARRQAIPTPEETYESLWQQLRVDLDAQYD